MTKEEMLEFQLRQRGIRNEKVLAAMAKISRDEFVPASLKDQAYQDNPLPIGYGQTISQPYIVALMTESLHVEKTDRVLEVGTGSGYQTAVLAELAAKVYSMDFIEALVKEAQLRLSALGYRNIHFKAGDGWQGWNEYAPYDKIMVTAAAEQLPPELVKQLKEGGQMAVPVGEPQGPQNLLIGVKKENHLEVVETIPVRFVPLVQHGRESKEQKN